VEPSSPGCSSRTLALVGYILYIPDKYQIFPLNFAEGIITLETYCNIYLLFYVISEITATGNLLNERKIALFINVFHFFLSK
jgi:hypothetical protein